MVYDPQFIERLTAGLRSRLMAWDVPASAELSLLTISENATFRVYDKPSGLEMILRVQRPDYHSEAEILSELAWVDALRSDGVVATPRPLPATDGTLLQAFHDGETIRHVVAFEFMSGKEPDTESDLVRWYGTLGEVNARLHAHSREWVRPEGFQRKVWDFDHILGDQAYWGDWRNGLGLTAEGAMILERVHAKLAEATAAYGQGEDRFGLVHCDLRTANLLVDGGRLGVIDFDDCGLSWFAYDFASSVSFMEEKQNLPELMAAWLEGYRRVTPLATEHVVALPIFVMLRRMQLTAWIASHAETPTAQAMGSAYTDGTVELAENFLAKA
ncbi:phosphotransferase enzyme family protein [Agrobacterium tumefaciens]|uniref:phosphotransferase enzyme family protein n=1 Tax=Agrobacterium tumefaciens TaxID=358 RepID=UPI00157308BD|nr:phosphotransferase [Agrobacterium tumefaciens]